MRTSASRIASTASRWSRRTSWVAPSAASTCGSTRRAGPLTSASTRHARCATARPCATSDRGHQTPARRPRTKVGPCVTTPGWSRCCARTSPPPSESASNRSGVEAARAYPHSTRDESPASHFVVDLLRASHPGSDVAIYNATGTRAGLPRGPITYGHIYALLPFDSVVATATLPAATIADAIVRGVTRGPIPIVSGIEVGGDVRGWRTAA